MSTRKGHSLETQRLVAPEQTLERIQGLLPAAGITRLANVTGLDTIGIPVMAVYRPNSRSLAVSQGKGLTVAAAKVSGLMEAIELWAAERPRLPLYRASHDEMRGEGRTLDLSAVPRSSTSSFRDNLALFWVEGRELLAGGAPIQIPYDLVHMDWTLPLSSGSESFLVSSNGLASGNHVLEATSHGICELVERDATTLWYCSSEETRRETRVSLATVDDPQCRQALEKFERAGIHVGVWETTSDVGIPSFLCMVTERDPNPLRLLPPMGGEGCHPCREIALLRALTEAAQKRLTMIAGSRDDLTYPEYKKRLDPAYGKRILALIDAAEAPRHFGDAPSARATTFEEDLAFEGARLRSVGVEQIAVVDLAPPELGISVVRVIIPGLEPMHDVAGYVPGARARNRLRERAS